MATDDAVQTVFAPSEEGEVVAGLTPQLLLEQLAAAWRCGTTCGSTLHGLLLCRFSGSSLFFLFLQEEECYPS